jgi:hypothetical protein
MTILFHRSVIGYQERTLHRCWVTSIRYWGPRILTGRCHERSPLAGLADTRCCAAWLVEALGGQVDELLDRLDAWSEAIIAAGSYPKRMPPNPAVNVRYLG